jgi:cell division protein FtsZ
MTLKTGDFGMEMDSWKGAAVKVIGVGGAGSNAVDRMIQIGIPGVDFIAANSDAQALARSEAPCKIRLGAELSRSLGAGGDPATGAKAAYESREQLRKTMCGADLVFIAAGMGGGTGTGAAPVVAQIAQAEKALTIAVVTKPFSFEGTKRWAIAEKGITCLRKEVDTLIVVPNDRLLEIVDEKRIPLDVAFRIADEVLRQVVQGISELVTRPGLINLDFADVRSIMAGADDALISIGHGEGEEKAIEAARTALASPLLNIEFARGAENILVNITGGGDLTLAEVSQAMEIICQAAMPQVGILFGTVIDPKMEGRVEITLIATGVEVGETGIAPPQAERLSLVEVLGDELVVPAFMRPRSVKPDEDLAVPALMQPHGRRPHHKEDLAMPAFMRSHPYEAS